jgi:multiple sugar transport system ATP-binding protein
VVNVPSHLEGADVEMGIRPEDIRVDHGREKTLGAKVEMISYVGAEKYIHARIGTTSLTLRAAREAFFQAGEMISLVIDPSKLHIFQKGKRVE